MAMEGGGGDDTFGVRGAPAGGTIDLGPGNDQFIGRTDTVTPVGLRVSGGPGNDFIVTTDDFGLVGLPPQVAEDIAQLPEVAEVVPFRFAPAFIGDDPTTPEVEGDTTGLSESMLRAGFAVVDDAAASKYQTEQGRAMEERQGLWKGCFVRPLPRARSSS